MQTRPYDGRDSRKLWLSREDQPLVLGAVADDQPRRRIAMQLGLHGLRTDEVVDVEPQHFETLSGSESDRLVIPDGKTGRREVPVSDDLARRVQMLKGARGMRKDEPVINRSKRSIREWITGVRETIAEETGDERWLDLGMHDLRRTWATDGYYSLAFQGIPIAEQLIMSWGGWAHTSTGRQTFRSDYLGPVPDRITVQAMGELGLP